MSTPDSIPSAVALLPCAEIRARIDNLLLGRFTGLAQVTFVPQTDMTLLVREGVVKQVYCEDTFALHRYRGETWKDQLAKYASGGFFTEALPVRALLFQKIAIEYRQHSTASERRTEELSELIMSLEKREKTAVLRLAWKKAAAFISVSSAGVSARRVIFFGDGIAAEEGQSGLNRINTWKEPECRVNIYDCDLGNDACVELQLSILFEWLCNYMLTQYGYLTGNVLVRSAARNLIIFAATQELDIRERDCILTDSMIFQSVEEAADAYRKLLNSIRHQMRTVIGGNLLASIEKQALNSLGPLYRELVRNYQLL